MSRAKLHERADHSQQEAAHQVFSYRWQVLKIISRPAILPLGSLLPGSKGTFVAFEFDTRYNDSLMRAHMGLQSNIGASVFRSSMRRVADTGGRSRWIFGHHHRRVDPDCGSGILSLLNIPELVRQTRGPSGALEDADFCT